MKTPRFLHKLYADFFGYFWLPCWFCGEMYGGHEEHGSMMINWDEGRSVCVNCKDKGETYNKQWMKDNPHPGYVMEDFYELV